MSSRFTSFDTDIPCADSKRTPVKIQANEPLYDTRGELNPAAMSCLLGDIKQTMGHYQRAAKYGLSPLSGAALRLAAHKTSVLSRSLNRQAVNEDENHRVNRRHLYSELKSIAWSLRFAHYLNRKNGRSNFAIEELANVITQMARVEFHQHGIGIYDQDADAATERMQHALPHLDHELNNYVEENSTTGLDVNLKLGFDACAARIGLKMGVGVSRDTTDFMVKDHDGDLIYARLRSRGASANVSATVGGSGMKAARLKGSAGVKKIRGDLYETADVRTMNQKVVQLGRERYRRGNEEEKKQRVNLTTTGAGVAIGNGLKRVRYSLKQRFLGCCLPQDMHPELTSEKLQKGAMPELVPEMLSTRRTYFRDSRSLFKGPETKIRENCHQSFNHLKNRLETYYGNLSALQKPSGLNRIVLDGKWDESRVDGRVRADFLKTEMLSSLPGNQPYISTGATTAVAGSVAYRFVPAGLWMAPHEAISKGCADAKQTEQRLQTIFASNPLIAEYPQQIRHALTEGRHKLAEVLAQVRLDIEGFEQQARGLLAGKSMSMSRQGARQLGRQIAEESAGKLVKEFFAAASNTKKSNQYMRDMTELALAHPEEFIGCCWNALSLSLAVLRQHMDEHALSEDSVRLEWENLSQRVIEPALLMSPEFLYKKSVLSVSAELERRKINASFNVGINLGLSATPAFTEQVSQSGALAPTPFNEALVTSQLTQTAAISVDVSYQKIAQHPNYTRNGEFVDLSFKLTGTGLFELPVRSFIDLIQRRFSELGHGNLADSGIAAGLELSLAGVSWTGGHSYTLRLHKPNHSDRWFRQYLQQEVSRTISGRINPDLGFSAGAGGSIAPMFSADLTSNAVVKTVLGNDPAIHLLQYPTLKNYLKEAGLMHKLDDTLQFPAEFREATDLRTMLIDHYFSNDNLLDVLTTMQCIRQNGPGLTGDDFNALAAESFSAPVLERYQQNGLDDVEFRRNIALARAATKEMSATERYDYFTQNKGDNTVGNSLLKNYLEGLQYFSEMKSLASFNKGLNSTPFELKVNQIDRLLNAPVKKKIPETPSRRTAMHAYAG
ncbi:hypothetical protein [Herbaspirillum sp. RTI4]|uniref:hypothetical protein n=1 Tax=Herbaspirillum sp. RTI4 TaxID=3048640 RepID=UPI002B234026|nr:hypothetical protein [Herbaspirillum sp. RTI4]